MAPTLVNPTAPARAPVLRTPTASVQSSVQTSISRRAGPTRSPLAQRVSIEIGTSSKSSSQQYASEEQSRLVAAPESPPSVSQASASCAALAEPEASPSSTTTLQLNNVVPLPEQQQASSSTRADEAVLPSLSIAASTTDAETASIVASSSWNMSGRDHNSVTIKENTNVKDAAGAIVKVLGRIPSVLVTALRLEAAHESLNRAVKSIAVARKYTKDEESSRELTFLPFHRSNNAGVLDPNLFAFLCFKTQLDKGLQLLEQDQTDLNVSRGSNANTMANAIIRIVKERGQAVMKAGGAEAIFIAMSAVVNARRRLKRSHGMDAMVVPAWITENTCSTLGRESKFLRFNILPCPINGPEDCAPQCLYA